MQKRNIKGVCFQSFQIKLSPSLAIHQLSQNQLWDCLDWACAKQAQLNYYFITVWCMSLCSQRNYNLSIKPAMAFFILKNSLLHKIDFSNNSRGKVQGQCFKTQLQRKKELPSSEAPTKAQFVTCMPCVLLPQIRASGKINSSLISSAHDTVRSRSWLHNKNGPQMTWPALYTHLKRKQYLQ